MTPDHFNAILKHAQASKADKDGWEALPEGTSLTLHLAHDGASLTLHKIEAVRQDGELVYARTPKKDLLCLARADLFAVGIEGAGSASPRRAGFA